MLFLGSRKRYKVESEKIEGRNVNLGWGLPLFLHSNTAGIMWPTESIIPQGSH